MTNYINSFNDLIRNRQVEQAIKLLNQQQSEGQITDVNDFTSKLDALVREISGSVLTPTLKVSQANENDIIDSASFNYQLSRLEDDLKAGFEEVENLETIRNSQNLLIKEVILKNLRSGISELNTKISTYEFLNKDTNGFTKALFSTFKEIKEERTTLTDNTSFLFIDPKTNTQFLQNENAIIDPIGERLVINSQENISDYPISIVSRVFDNEALKTELDTSRNDMPLSNIIDQQSNTFWGESILFRSPSPKLVKIKLEFNSVKTINYIEIEPALNIGMIFSKLELIDNCKHITTITPNQFFDSPISVLFNPTSVKSVIVTLTNNIGNEIHFSSTQNFTTSSDIVSVPLTSTINLPILTAPTTTVLQSDTPAADIKQIPSTSVINSNTTQASNEQTSAIQVSNSLTATAAQNTNMTNQLLSATTGALNEYKALVNAEKFKVVSEISSHIATSIVAQKHLSSLISQAKGTIFSISSTVLTQAQSLLSTITQEIITAQALLKTASSLTSGK